MMRMRAFWMLALALLLAGGSVYLARNWLENQVQPVIVQENKAPEIPLTKVVVAGTALQFGNVLRREHLRLVDWPAATVPAGAFASFDELLSAEEQRVILRPVEPNEPILKSKVSGFGGRAILSSLVAPDMRAMTIRINDVTGVAGFVLPGDRVDILLTRERGGSPVTDIFMQNIKVLGIDQDANQARQQPGVVRAITFEVTPTQAQKLVLSQRVGSLSLALRHTTNVDAIKPETISIRDLRIGEANVPEQPEPASLVLQEAERPQIAAAPRKVEPKKPSGGTVATKVTARKSPLSAVRIVRALKATSYEVQPEKGGASTGSGGVTGGSPVNLLPSSGGQKDSGSSSSSTSDQQGG
jgi:pilus assembly protein CpaB